MKSPTKNIIFIFLAVILLPTLIFSIYEIGSFRENERVIESIYGNQLDAILYSVNQYSEDVTSGWANDIEDISNEQGYDALSQFLEQSAALELCHIFDSSNKSAYTFYSHNLDTEKDPIQIEQLLHKEEKTSKQLAQYIEEEYRKLEPFNIENSNLQVIMFALRSNGKKYTAIIGINPSRFIGEILDPKIQEITQEKFYIGAYYKTQTNHIYSSDKEFKPESYKYNKEFWLLTDYYLGIELKDQTINELVKTRSKKNLYLIVIIDFVLLLGALLIYRNIKKQMELSRIKSDFISNVSHEIRTPLALISMYIETLDMGRIKTEEKKKEYYGIISQETQRLSNMVNNILNFSKIENNKREYSFTSANLNSIITDVVNTFSYQLEKKGFQITINLDENIPHIQADVDALTETVINLIDNAVKYSNGNKEIYVSTGEQKEHLYIDISDKGIGIPDNEQNRIFEKFYRVTDGNLAYKAKGSGLGLAIVKHVMLAHHGRVEVSSKINEGSTFKLVFPINKQHE